MHRTLYLFAFIFLITSQIATAQTGPGGVGNKNGTSSLSLWLRADKNVNYNSLDSILAWDDYSGNGNNFTHSTTEPIIQDDYLNSFPAVYFYTDAAGLERSDVDRSDLFSSSENTIVFVKNSESGHNWFNWDGLDDDIINFTLSNDNVNFNFGGTSLESNTNVTGNNEIIIAEVDGDDQNIFLNGIEDASGTNNNSLSSKSTTLFLGTQDGTDDEGWTGHISEIFVFNRSLNEAEHNLISNSLSAKYNISLSDNDYYAGDEEGNDDFDFDVVGIGEESDGSHTASTSAGVRIFESNESLEDGDYVFIGHDNSVDSITTLDCDGELEQRWNRSWYLDKTGNTDIKISFDFSEGVGGGSPAAADDYRLIYRSSNSGDFSEVTVSNKGIDENNNDQVFFEVDNDELNDGYYTIATTDRENSPVDGSKTWYTYRSAEDFTWENWTTWTLDPDGSLLLNSNESVPGASDSVVVLNGHWVTTTENNKACNYLEIRSGGIVDIEETNGHDFGSINGRGTLRLESDDFPSGDASEFISKGTVEYRGGSTTYSISNQLEYYNLKINLDDAANTLVLTDSITVGNKLTIQRGEFQIQNDNSTDIITLEVEGDISVQENGSFTVGEGKTIGSYEINGSNSTLPDQQGEFHDIFHQIYAYGDFTNEGNVSFTNQSAPDYNNFTENGAVSLYMRGASDNEMKLYNTTDLYNLIIDKGSDQTYTLNLYSAESGYFTLYGPNSVGRLTSGFTGDFSATDPEIRKALWIYHGTLKLTGNVDIPTLTEGQDCDEDENQSENINGDYAVGASGALWLAGSNVEVYSTAEKDSQVPTDANGLDPGGSHQAFGILGKLQISDGAFGTRNSAGLVYRPVSTGHFIVKGGTVDIAQFRSTYTGDGLFTYDQSGGTVTVDGTGEINTSYGIFDLAESSSVFQMSGGEIILQDNTDADHDFYINSGEGNYSVTGGTITFELGEGETFDVYTHPNLWDVNIQNPGNSGNFSLYLDSSLVVSNNLVVGDYSTLDLTNGHDLNIGGNLTIEANGGEIKSIGGSEDIDITFDGSGNSILTVENTNTPLNAYNFKINKDKTSNYVKLASTGYSDDEHPLVITNDFTINKGIFEYDIFTTQVNGNLNNSGTMGTDTASGRIELTDSDSQQMISTTVSGNPSYGHILLDDDDGASLDGNNARFKQLTLTNGILDIANYRLTVDTNEVYGTDLDSDTPSGMIQLSGEHAGRGLKLKLDDTYSNGDIITFPVGTPGEYTRYNVKINADIGAISGHLTVIPVARKHPSHDLQGNNDVMTYYWETIANDLNEVSNDIIHEFHFDDNSIDPVGKEYYYVGDEWEMAGNANNSPLVFDDGDDFINGFESGYFSSGTNNGFKNISTVYSNGTGGGNWLNNASWEGGSVPEDYEFVVIRSEDSIYMEDGDNGIEVASLDIRNKATLDLHTTSGHYFTKVFGAGEIRVSSDDDNNPPDIPGGDLEGLLTNDTATFEYYGTGNYTIPSDIAGYPNLEITGSNNKTFPDVDVAVRKNLYIDGETAILNENNDVDVYDSVIVFNKGVLQFPNSGINELTVGKSIDLDYDGTADNNTIEIANGGDYTNHHSIFVNDDIVMSDNADLTLFHSDTEKGGDLYFQSDSSSTVTASSAELDLNHLYIQKDALSDTVNFYSSLSLTNANQGLNLETGTLILDHGDINVSLSANQGEFNIPSTAELNLQAGAIANVTGADGYINLDGKLRLKDNSKMLLTDNGDNGNDNYIKYGSSGYSAIEVNDDAELTVGSQIRRGTTTSAGVLDYTQTGGTVTVGNNSAPTSGRGVFEVLNSGSNFTFTDGDLMIARSQTENSPALYLDPDISDVSPGAYITIGADRVTPDEEVIGMYINVPVKNLRTVDPGGGNSFEAKVFTVAPTLDTLNIGSNTTFNCNEMDLNLTGDFINNGTFNGNNNTTFFIGDKQNLDISESATTNFYNLSFSNNEAFIHDDITVESNIDIASGTKVEDNENNINLKGDIDNSGIHYSSSTTTGGIIFNGSERQEITGAGEFGRLEIDNSKGLALNNDLTIIDNTLTLTNGSLYIRDNQFTMGVNSNVTGPFGENEMIVTNGAYSDGGVKHDLNSGTTNDILIPIGVPGKYTPVELDIKSSESGSVTIKPVNEAHRTVTDENNVLQYYWTFNNSGITDIEAEIRLNYQQSDVSVTGSNSESDYIPAYIKDELWAKFDQSKVNATNNTIDFTLNNVSTLRGDYTAGMNEAIPDTIPVYYTTSDGNWEDSDIWAIEGEDGAADDYPNGHIVKIDHEVTITENLKSAYRTIIDTGAVLDIGSTIGHYLGAVSGYGHLKLGRGNLPAGDYSEFFSCSGGSIEFGGDKDYTIPDEGSTYRRLVLSGSGLRVLPDIDITICDTLLVDNVLLDNKTHDNNIFINGIFYLENGGSFDAGSGPATVTYNGSSQQNLGGFTGENAFNNFTIDNSSGISLTDDIKINGTLDLKKGIITTNGSSLSLANTGDVTPDGGSSSSYIDGIFKAEIDDGNDFAFPIGNNSRYGKLDIISTATSDNTEYWEAQYYNDNPDNDYDTSSYATPLQAISGNEYWRVKGPGEQSHVKIRWDDESILPAETDDRENNLHIAQWNSSSEEWESVGDDVDDNDVNDGTVQTNDKVNIKEHIFTLASEESEPKPTASFTTTDTSVCEGGMIELEIELTGDPAWTIEIYKDGSPYDNNTYPASSSPRTITISSSAVLDDAGTYSIESVEDDNNTTGNVYGDDVEVTVSPKPEPVINSSHDPESVCQGSVETYWVENLDEDTDYYYSWNVTGGEIRTGKGTDEIQVEWQDAGDKDVDVIVGVDGVDGCENNSSMDVEVNETPNPDVILESTQPICYPSSVELNANTSPATSTSFNYTWSTDITGIGNFNDNTVVDPSYELNDNPEDIYITINFEVEVENDANTNCSDSDNLDVNIYRRPETGNQYYVPNDFDQE